MDNFFKKIQQLPVKIKEKKEEVSYTKQDMITYLLKENHGRYPNTWQEFNQIISEGKLLDDKEISSAIKDGYIRALKQYVGELPAVISRNNEEKRWMDQHICFERTKVILNIFQAIDYQKKRIKGFYKKGGQIETDDSFIEFFKNNPEFFRLTKESLIKSLDQADTSEENIQGAQVFVPAVTPDEIKKDSEVQKSFKNVIIRALQDGSLSLAIDFQKISQLTQEMIKSSDLQQAILDAVEIKKEKIKEILEKNKEAINKLGINIVDYSDIWQEEEKIRKIEGWIIKKEIEK